MSSITINGSTQDVTAGSSFRDVVMESAQNAGFNKFRVIINGEEVNPEDAPATFSAGMNVELRPFEVAG